MNTDSSNQIAIYLLEIEAIKLSIKKPFILSSGGKSPIYCDNRISLSYPKIRIYIKEYLAKSIKTNFPQVEAIAGVATAGIPQGALVADALNLPFIYVRSKPKEHGMKNKIEGEIVKGQKVVLIEDLISTGRSVLDAAYALEEGGIKVLGVAAICTYGLKQSENNFKKAKIELASLTNYTTILKEAKKLNYISKEDLIQLNKWRESPETWNPQ